MAERAAVNRLTKVRFLPGARQDASSKLLGLTACIGVGTGFRTYVGSIPTKPNASCLCGSSSIGRALPFQGGCCEIESRLPLH